MLQSSTVLDIEQVEQNTKTTAVSRQPSILTDIYNEKVNIAIWKSSLTSTVKEEVKMIMSDPSRLNVVMTAGTKDMAKKVAEHSAILSGKTAFCAHIELLVDMFSTLFELKRVGLRLTKLDKAMCPKFHVDKVPCRLVTTFSGEATQWLPNHKVDRSKLGAGSLGKSDETSGIINQISDINQLELGDVALLKGEGWHKNTNLGLVHRSPAVKVSEARLLLTLDFID